MFPKLLKQLILAVFTSAAARKVKAVTEELREAREEEERRLQDLEQERRHKQETIRTLARQILAIELANNPTALQATRADEALAKASRIYMMTADFFVPKKD